MKLARLELAIDFKQKKVREDFSDLHLTFLQNTLYQNELE